MAWKDELNNAKKVFQNGTPKEILGYIWDYYKWHLIATVFVVGMLGSIVYTNMTARDYVLGGVILNSTAEENGGSELEQSFLAYSPVDREKDDIFFDTNYFFSSDTDPMVSADSYETLQILTAKIAAGEIDFMVGDLASMNNFGYRQYFYELSEVLSEELLEKYEPYFLYYDRAVLKELNNIDAVFDTSKSVVYPDPKKPELMEEPVPVFIDVSACENLKSVYPYGEDEYAVAFAVNGENTAKVLEFLEYLME